MMLRSRLLNIVLFSIFTVSSCFLWGQTAVYPPESETGIINVTLAPYFADNTGATDATSALQSALNEYPNGSRIIYLPAGTYLVSDRLDWPSGFPGNEYKRTTLQGVHRDSTIILLTADNPLYQDPENRRGVLYTGPGPAQRFGNEVRNLTVDVNKGNPGAAGIQFNANNFGTVKHVKIRSADGQGAIGLDCAFAWEIGPAFISHVEIEGFDYGIRCNADMNSLTFEHITLRNQNLYGIYNRAQQLNIRGLFSENEVTAVFNEANSQASMCLFDAEFIGTGAAATLPAIRNEKNMFLRNCSFTGYNISIQNTDWENCGSISASYIEEHHAHCALTKLFESDWNSSLNLPIAEIPEVAWDHPDDWVSIVDFGAIGGDGEDDSAALQSAIDSGASTIYLPGGTQFTFDSEVLITGSVKRIIGLRGRIEGNGVWRFIDGDAPVTVIERLNSTLTSTLHISHESDRTLVLQDMAEIRFEGNGPGDFFINNVVSDAASFNYAGQNIWARQLNIEEETTKILNNGANLWILGYKTERPGTIIHTLNGGTTEVMGAFVYSTGGPKIEPMFLVEDARLSVNGIKETNFNGNYFETWVEETRSDETRILHKDSIPRGNFYFLADNDLVLNTPVAETANFYSFPNPGNGIIQLVSDVAIQQVQVFDAFGRLCKEASAHNLQSIDMGKLAPGIYFIKAGQNPAVVRQVITR